MIIASHKTSIKISLIRDKVHTQKTYSTNLSVKRIISLIPRANHKIRIAIQRELHDNQEIQSKD
jgi:hypothetical protein